MVFASPQHLQRKIHITYMLWNKQMNAQIIIWRSVLVLDLLKNETKANLVYHPGPPHPRRWEEYECCIQELSATDRLHTTYSCFLKSIQSSCRARCVWILTFHSSQEQQAWWPLTKKDWKFYKIKCPDWKILSGVFVFIWVYVCF